MATKEYVTAVVKAREERNAAHAVEKEVRKEAIKADDLGDPVVRLLHSPVRQPMPSPIRP